MLVSDAQVFKEVDARPSLTVQTSGVGLVANFSVLVVGVREEDYQPLVIADSLVLRNLLIVATFLESLVLDVRVFILLVLLDGLNVFVKRDLFRDHPKVGVIQLTSIRHMNSYC